MNLNLVQNEVIKVKMIAKNNSISLIFGLKFLKGKENIFENIFPSKLILYSFFLLKSVEQYL